MIQPTGGGAAIINRVLAWYYSIIGFNLHSVPPYLSMIQEVITYKVYRRRYPRKHEDDTRKCDRPTAYGVSTQRGKCLPVCQLRPARK